MTSVGVTRGYPPQSSWGVAKPRVGCETRPIIRLGRLRSLLSGASVSRRGVTDAPLASSSSCFWVWSVAGRGWSWGERLGWGDVPWLMAYGVLECEQFSSVRKRVLVDHAVVSGGRLLCLGGYRLTFEQVGTYVQIGGDARREAPGASASHKISPLLGE